MYVVSGYLRIKQVGEGVEWGWNGDGWQTLMLDGRRVSAAGEKLTLLKTNVEASNDALSNCEFANLEMLRFLLLTKKSQNFNILH